MSTARKSGNGDKMSLNQLILTQITLNLITMSTNNIKLEKLFKEKFGEGSLDFAIEQGFDKEELLKSIENEI